MTMDAGARIYSPGGHLLQSGDRLEQPGLAAALGAVAAEGGRSVYTGTLGDALVELVQERGGLLSQRDLQAYRAEWSDPVSLAYLGTRFLTRAGLSGVPETLSRLPRFRGLSEPERAIAWAEALGGDPLGQGHTTNITVVDADGSACVLTTSLGLG